MANPAPLSPQWWLDRLSKQLRQRQTQMQLYDAYYCGNHPLPFVTKAHTAKMHNEFRKLLEDSQANFMGLVVDAIEDRLKVEGFRLSARSSETDDARSWEIWQANQMDAESKVAFVEALVKGVSYLSVWDDGGDYPTIAVEDPCETIVGYKPGTACRERAAALKMWTDDWTGKQRANVYLTDGIYKFEAAARPAGTLGLGRWFGARDETSEALVKWTELTDEFVGNPIGIIPVVPIRNRPRLAHEGESELVSLTRIQNSINGFLFMLALAGYFGAHKQRWATGVKLMFDERTGKALEPWDIAVDKIIVEGNPNAKFGEFSDTSLDGYIKAIDQKVQHLSVISRVPKHYLLPEGQEPSGDAIKSAESGLVKKVEKKQVPFGEGIEEAMRIARLFDNGGGDAPVDGEVVWADAQTESEAVRTDSTIKQYESKIIPWEFAAERLGYSQTEIARMRGMRQADLLERQLLEAGENVNLNISA